MQCAIATEQSQQLQLRAMALDVRRRVVPADDGDLERSACDGTAFGKGRGGGSWMCHEQWMNHWGWVKSGQVIGRVMGEIRNGP